MTKLFWQSGPEINEFGHSKKLMYESRDISLKWIGMNYLDVLMCHRPYPEIPIEETVWEIQDLIRQGKIRYLGLSEWTVNRFSMRSNL